MSGYRRYSPGRVCVCLLLAALALRVAMAGQSLAARAAASAAVIQTLLSAEVGSEQADVLLEAAAAAEEHALSAALEAVGQTETAQPDETAAEPPERDEAATETAAEQPSQEAAEAAAGSSETVGDTEDAVLTFSQTQAEALEIENDTDYEIDVEALLAAPLTLDFSGDGPKILIVHTHTSEAYTPSAGWEYEESDALRTIDDGYNMLRVGDELAEQLEQAGIEVLHDRTYHDYPVYDGAYARVLDTIEGYLEEYPSIQMVLDVHRDASENADGTLAGPTVTVDGADSAQIMLVVGTDAGGLEHPDWQGNLSCALKLQALLEEAAPGICRSLDLRQERFNQHATAGSLLVEIGSAGNTMDEALAAASAFAGALIRLAQSLSG